jgi:hypothetical protein
MGEAKWKRCEREVAKLLGGQRQPITGRPSPDVVTNRLAVEVKLRSRIPRWLLRGLGQAEAAAEETGRMPLLVLVFAQGKGRRAKRLAVLPLEALVESCRVGGD